MRFAEARGWQVVKSNGHIWAQLRCPVASGIRHIVPVFSTPKDAHYGAKHIVKQVLRCPHGTGGK